MEKMEKLNLSRDPSRLTGKELATALFDDFIMLAGDRLYGEDTAIFGGIAMLEGMPVTVIAQDKGRELNERSANNFGMSHPEGYRKAQRLALAAAKFNRPIITIVDTAGAYPGIGSEERGQSSAIANCLFTFSDLPVPVISIILSEGGSGGALALCHSDYIYAFENCYYSVISPEGYSQILYKGKKDVADIIEDLPIFSKDLLNLGIVDSVIEEPADGIKMPLDEIEMYNLKKRLSSRIGKLQKKSKKDLVSTRHNRFRKYGR